MAASLDPATDVASKDVNIDLTTGVSARLYLLNLSDTPPKKLVYFHGGSFIIGPTSSRIPQLLQPLDAKVSVLIVSDDYHRAHGDFGSIFLAVDYASANIAYSMVMGAGVNVGGPAMVHLYFLRFDFRIRFAD